MSSPMRSLGSTPRAEPSANAPLLRAQSSQTVELVDVDGDAQISQQEFMKAMPQFGLGYVLPIEVIQLFNAFALPFPFAYVLLDTFFENDGV